MQESFSFVCFPLFFQEQELADLLERLGQFPVEDMPCDETPPHKASSGRRKRLNSGPSGASPGGSNAIADYGDGAGRVQTTNVDGIGTGGSPVGVPLGNPFSSGRNETIAAAAAAAAHKARVATVPSTAAGAGTTIPREVHRILELHWSSREPLDHGTFEELKRKIESAVKVCRVFAKEEKSMFRSLLVVLRLYSQGK